MFETHESLDKQLRKLLQYILHFSKIHFVSLGVGMTAALLNAVKIVCPCSFAKV